MSVMEAACLLAAVVLPLFFQAASLRVFEPEKTAALRLLAAMALAALAVVCATRDGRATLDIGRLRSPVPIAAAALVVATAISTMLSLDAWQSLTGSYQRQGGLLTLCAQVTLFAAVALQLRSPLQRDRLFVAVTLASVAAASYAVAQRCGLDPLSWDTTLAGGNPLAKAPGTLGNPTFLSGYLAVAMFVTGALVHRRPFAAAALVVQAVGIWASGSRGAIVAVAAGAMVFALALAAATRAWRLVAGTIVVGGAVAASLVLLNLPDGPLASVRDAGPWRRVAHVFDATDETSRVRLLIWQGARGVATRTTAMETVDGLSDPHARLRCLFGYGPETLHISFARSGPAELSRLERPGLIADRGHNESVDALATGGLVGLALTMTLVAAVLLTACRAVCPGRRAQVVAALAMGAGAGAAVVLVSAAGGPAWLRTPVIGAGMVAGFAAALSSLCWLNRAPRQSSPIAAAALVAHIVDVQVGITTVASRTLFWMLAGGLLAVASSADAAAPSDATATTGD